jgi:superfamily I DNA/RNA helicase
MSMEFKPSPYQTAVFDFVRDAAAGSAVIRAVAGSGKTTTIVKALELIDPASKVLFLAFNKKIATELQTRVPSYVKASTFHAAGFGAWRFGHRSCKVNADKVRHIAGNIFSPDEQAAFGQFAVRMVGYAKNAGVGALVEDKLETWQDIADRFDCAPERDDVDLSLALERASALLSASVDAANARNSEIDFDDMLFMPMRENARFSLVDWLFIDEAQDTNPVQLALLRRMLAPGGRLVAVGDDRQAIYGFRGAAAGSMDAIKAAFGCRELDLTISYRCAKSIVKLAQSIVPHIEASETAPEGSVTEATLQDGEFARFDARLSEPFSNSDAILCRNTAPLVALAYRLIGFKVGCKVLGREIGAALVTLIRKLNAKGVDALLVKLDALTEREVAKAMARGQEQKAEAAQDRAQCIKAVVEALKETERTVPAVCAAIDSMFTDDGRGILTLCTCHKAKGLEWDRVFIYRRDLMPSKFARQDWQKEQESNLEYVAITRAKKELVFLS